MNESLNYVYYNTMLIEAYQLINII